MRPRRALIVLALVACDRGAQSGALDASEQPDGGVTDDALPDASEQPETVAPALLRVEPSGEVWLHEPVRFVFDGVLHGEFHWHKHDKEDELFFVLEGQLILDLRDPEERTVELLPRQGMVVPKGIVHRTRANERTVVLMVEPATVKPTGD
jgi:mannose-6-phosphate isomerase-like protein (cupin superfamily)